MTTQSDERIVQRYLDGTLSADELVQLNDRLRDSRDLRMHFMETLNIDAALQAVCESVAAGHAVDGLSVAPESVSPRCRRRSWSERSWPRCRTVMAAAVLLLAGAFAGWFEPSREWATVQQQIGTGDLTAGQQLANERCSIQTGLVELVTARGARVVIEAPAGFQFKSPQRLRLLRGRLSAEVPVAARGFTVVTPDGDAVDLGTRFGVDVPTAGAAEIHVFQGEVIAKASDGRTSHSLRDGDAVVMNRGMSATRDLRSAAFIQPDEVPQLNAGLASGQQGRSLETLAALRNDPALIALLDFESDVQQPGVFRVVQGRWPGSAAAEFVSVGDHLKLDAGGDQVWPQLTLAAWVRLDRLGAPYQSLLHTDGWSDNRPGQVHWMVTHATTMRLALYGNTLAPGSDERHGFPDSRTPVLPEQGRWVHLAVVYNADARSVRFFLNGEFDKETRQAVAHPARLGPAQVGNWDRDDRKLSGRIDELILLGRCLNDAEVRELYAAGCPYR